MTEHGGAEEPILGQPHRRWVRWRLAVLLPLYSGLLWGFFIWWYPYSWISLFLFSLPVYGVVLLIGLIARVRWTLRRTSIAAVVTFVLGTVLVSGCSDPPGPGRISQCRNNLHQIVLALLKYERQYGHFPPAYIADASGRPMHSWRVLVLPFLGHKDAYDWYRFDEPWDGPHNRQLLSVIIPEYLCPAQSFSAKPMTSYVAVVGPATAWPGKISTKLGDIRDGTPNTVLVVEIADSGIHWMEPRDLDMSAMAMSVNPADSVGISSHHRADSWTRRLLGADVGMADGNVRFLAPDTPEDELKAMLTIADGESK